MRVPGEHAAEAARLQRAAEAAMRRLDDPDHTSADVDAFYDAGFELLYFVRLAILPPAGHA